ncbi:SUN domain-containing protein 2-like [Nasonia vitripennis]|uniref:Uncharacterized protein n=1 Tax=Nasonia vitripennis TaxID=7425 RepID=A0A7M7QKE6_NASVI|nr:SUN domain-containing protein 2 [Nasonia vitripennis]XP_031789148.1 SUN domain-containing protein 2-like [Nasonia vitripennis]
MNEITDENDDDEKNNGRNESNSQNDNINNHDDKKMKPLEDNEIESVKFFVAVKFIDDKEKHHVIVTSDKVLKFDPVKTERKKYKNPYKVLKYDTDRQQEFAVPANILDHSDSLVDLKNQHKRYVYPKSRLSDALEKLAQESESEDDGLDTKDQIKKDRKDKVMRQKKNQTVPSNTRKNVNKCDNMQMVDKQTQRELIKRKAQQLLKDNETVSSMKQMKMNKVSANYKLDFSNNT